MKTPKLALTIKNILVFTIFSFIILSCGSDDSSDPDDIGIDPSELLTFYEEPFLEFGTLQEALLTSEGLPEGQSPDDTDFTYYPDYPGIIFYGYLYQSDFMSPDPETLRICAIRVFSHEHNRDFLINALTQLYGEPELIVDETLLADEYKFIPQNGEYTVHIYSPREFNVTNTSILVNYFDTSL